MLANALSTLNPCAAGTVYMRFQTSFSSNKNAIEIHRIVRDRCTVNERIQFCRCLFFINGHIFRHLKLEFTFAVPALNERKIETNNSAT